MNKGHGAGPELVSLMTFGKRGFENRFTKARLFRWGGCRGIGRTMNEASLWSISTLPTIQER